ncbi:MFS transporter [Allorhizocola rhizosphaerae]|uniref:MFS transporter n=1 Tax=Allorhizocola rhizosphaerae TaxID=1872709 RepID=UPI000E3EA821|nr:MFS transporter [Allorhizocola rhizosphaerae]
MGHDFRRLWFAYGVSEFGSYLAMGALPLIAVLVLGSPVWQVSLLAAIGTITSALVALPLGPWIEFRRKRPIMIGADVVRALVLLSVPVAYALQVLSFAQLCVVASAQALGQIVFTAAGGAHLKALVPQGERVRALGRLEATMWSAVTVGPMLGGLLISSVGKTVTIALDAVTFLVSAVGIGRLRTPEPPPPPRVASFRWGAGVTSGWRYVFQHDGLRPLFLNAMLFGGGVMWSSPLYTVLMLQELRFTPWQYGLALGIPGLGGVIGALLARRLVRRHGERRVMLVSGVLRAIWLPLIPLAGPGVGGLAVIAAANLGVLLSAGVFNPVFGSYRMSVTVDDHMARVQTTWSISSKTVQPLFMMVGGVFAALTSVRTGLWAAAVLVLLSVFLLPWRRRPVSAENSLALTVRSPR